MKSILMVPFLILFLIIGSCSIQEEGTLARIDIQRVGKEGNYEEELIVVDSKKMSSITKYIERIQWEPKTKAEMTRKEDVRVTLFFSSNKNMPEKLYEYKIWVNRDGSAVVISSNPTEGYGTLNTDNAKQFIIELFKSN